ncbi:MAG: dTDP-4-dehydrorhamnose reductase, partial [bacterium]
YERIVITGCQGLLGQKLCQLLCPENEVIGLDVSPHTHLRAATFTYIPQDITKRDELLKTIAAVKPGFIVNTAALTDVDRCEEDKDLCWRVNVLGVENLIRAAKRVHAHLIQISSDYVFDGTNAPYRETDAVNPIGFYGKSKLAAENVLRGEDVTHVIVRTQVLYGVAPQVRPNFVHFVVNRLQTPGEILIVDDQRGNPTLADDLARAIARVIQLRKKGIYHIAGRESLSRFEFARKIAQQFEEDPERIKPIKTLYLQQKAPRPQDSTFILEKCIKELMFLPRDADAGLVEFHHQWQQLSKV